MDKKFDGEFFLLDGAMGTMLQKAGMPAGMAPEVFAQEHPDIVESIHREYIKAGSAAISTATFCANRKKLAPHGLDVTQVITSAVAIARRAAEGKALVALDVGPIGELLQPAGTISFDEAYALFKEQVVAGENAGADYIFFETFTDLAELRAAVLAAKENTGLPIFASMSFEEGGRTFTGAAAECFAITMTGLGVDALGVNCSLGPKNLMPIIRRIAEHTELPLIVKANAGLPDARDGHYDLTARAFAEEMSECADIGVKFIGGCCGTTPEFISELKSAFENRRRNTHPVFQGTCLCSASRLCVVDRPRIIGERINPTGKKRFQEALRSGEMNYILAQGIDQTEAGADILDVNVGLPGQDEVSLMREVVTGLCGVTDLPLQIDSNDPAVVEAGLRSFCGKAVINSVNGKTQSLNTILPLAKKYGAAVVGLTVDENGIPDSAGERFEIAGKIIAATDSAGIPRRDVFIDCLCMTVSANTNAAGETLKAVKMVKEAFGVHCVLGVSNISFGLPNRELVNRSFLSLALEAGVDLPIINPNIASMTDTIFSYRLLRGYDEGCADFIAKYANAPAPPAKADAPAGDIFTAISRGLACEAEARAKALLKEKPELEIVNEYLIPALDAVGERFERGEIFLPQLIRSADAAGAAFEVIKAAIASKGSATDSRSKIVIATVHGDVHDIGKNIVKTVLSNYGYDVIDLGKDVPPEKVVETAKRENVRLVGLSALMTTTLPAMEETIRQLHAENCHCKIMVGGAVLTADYAAEIGADFYARDAKASADIAKLVLG